MAIVLANQKKAAILETSRAYLNGLTYRLFVNDYTPVAGMVEGDFTECTDTGYAAKTPVFPAAALEGGDLAVLIAPMLTWVFTHTGADFVIRGYFVIDPADSKVVYAERAPVDVTITAAGQTYSVTPKYTRDTAP